MNECFSKPDLRINLSWKFLLSTLWDNQMNSGSWDVWAWAKWRSFAHTQITDCKNMVQAKLKADPICIQSFLESYLAKWIWNLWFWKAIMCFSSNFIFTNFRYVIPKERFVKITVFNIGKITFDTSCIVLCSFDPAWFIGPLGWGCWWLLLFFKLEKPQDQSYQVTGLSTDCSYPATVLSSALAKSNWT